ncbi:MAG: hypothetical protein Q9167_007050 [Letrouitia subvulpina]
MAPHRNRAVPRNLPHLLSHLPPCRRFQFPARPKYDLNQAGAVTRILREVEGVVATPGMELVGGGTIRERGTGNEAVGERDEIWGVVREAKSGVAKGKEEEDENEEE